MYNLFGDERLLRDPLNETSPFQFQRWCRSLGYEFQPLYYDNTLAYPTPRHYWKELFNPQWRQACRGQRSALLVDIMGSATGTLHTVGVILYVMSTETPSSNGVSFTVHDSCKNEPLEYFTLAEFQASGYASAYAIFMVGQVESMTELLPSQPGHEQPWADNNDKSHYADVLRSRIGECPTCHSHDCDH
jgi:hypothetical protein